MLEEKLSYQVIGSCMQVHSLLGPGLLEQCYHNGLFYELTKQKLKVEYNAPYTVQYDGHVVGEYFADLVVDKRILLELKSVKSFSDAHVAQLLNYLHISGVHVGYLLNFQGIKLKYKRFVV